MPDFIEVHAARHTWATLALEAGKSIRWVADQLGHADPALTLRVYAHAIREAEPDLSFVDFGVTERRYPSPTSDASSAEDTQPREILGGPSGTRTLDPRVKRAEPGHEDPQ